MAAMEVVPPEEITKRVPANTKNIMLAHCHMGVEGSKALAAAIVKCPTVEWIDLWNNQMEDEGFKVVVEKLMKVAGTIKSLSLASNKLTVASASVLAGLLAKINKLEVLLIYDNAFGNDGLKIIAEALTKNGKYLKQLHIASNGISGQGLIPLAMSLPMLGSLEKLWLGPNPLTDEGLVITSNIIGSCSSLNSLHLDDTKCTETGVTALATAIATCPSLLKITLKFNEIGPGLLRAVQVEAEKNKTPERVAEAAAKREAQRKKLKI